MLRELLDRKGLLKRKQSTSIGGGHETDKAVGSGFASGAED